MNTKHELTLEVLPRYLKAVRIGKGKILAEISCSTSDPMQMENGHRMPTTG